MSTEHQKYSTDNQSAIIRAYRARGQTDVPALVVTADAEDCLVASLVENCARRQHRAIDLLQDRRPMNRIR